MRTIFLKFVQKIKVKNKMGIHTRPATAIVKLLQNSKSKVEFTYKGETVNAKSILSILMLAVRKNSSLTVTCDGEDAQDTMNALLQAFDSEFGEAQ